MIIAAKVIRPRRPRLCPICMSNCSTGDPCLRLYGAAFKGDPPGAIYCHLDCIEYYDQKIRDAVLDYKIREEV